MRAPTFIPVADHALLVQLGDKISDHLSARVQQLDKVINEVAPAGLVETIPAFVNLLVEFDPLITDHHTMEASIRELASTDTVQPLAGASHEVLVCYDEDLAQDIGGVAKAAGMSIEAVVALHMSGSYRVGMYGFAPGYAYLSGVPEPLQMPRKATALRDIPAGSLLIAGPQCLVSTLTMPTGWSIIGRSPTKILRNDPKRPFLFDVGDQVQFKRIDRATFDKLNNEGAT